MECVLCFRVRIEMPNGGHQSRHQFWVLFILFTHPFSWSIQWWIGHVKVFMLSNWFVWMNKNSSNNLQRFNFFYCFEFFERKQIHWMLSYFVVPKLKASSYTYQNEEVRFFWWKLLSPFNGMRFLSLTQAKLHLFLLFFFRTQSIWARK